MKIKNSYSNLIEKMKAAVISDQLRTRLVFYLVNIALSLTSFIMTVVNYFTAEYILLISTLIFSILCLLNIIIAYFSWMPEKVVYVIFSIEAMLLLAFFFISGIPDGFSALWICLIPSFSLFIFGMKYGSLFSGTALIMMIFLFWIPAGRNLLLYSYTETFMLRFPLLYSSIYLISLLIEYVRKETQKQLEKAKAEYRHLYRHDALTGLYNRYGIKEFIEMAFKGNSSQDVSVILMDIDDFKKINDVYGHECGDEVLKMVASVPLKVMCEHCHCCRWGGEEFLLIMQCDHDPIKVAEKIRHEIEQTPIMYADKVIYVTTSIGVCIAKDQNDLTIHNVIEGADVAMYESKHNGKNQVTVTRM